MVGISSTPMMHLHCLNLSITTAIVPPRTNGVLGARLLTIVGSFPLQTNCPSPSTLDFSKMNNTFSSCRKSLCKNNPFDVLYEIGVHPCRNWTKTTDRMHVVIASISLCLPASPVILQQFSSAVSHPQIKHLLISFILLAKFIRSCSTMPKKAEDTTSMYKPTTRINPENSVIIDDTQVPLATGSPLLLGVGLHPNGRDHLPGTKNEVPFRSVSWSISLS